MATVTDEVQGPSDAELIDAVRHGKVSAYGELYERHRAAAYNLARQLSRSQAQADDLVSDAFAKVLETLKAGRGPDSAFRAYLLTALRHTAYDKTRRDRKLELVEDVGEANPAATSVPFTDTAVAGLERTLAARAFAELPERWQAVLWHTEIEGQSPAEVAPILGLTPNGVSALAYRAREGLKQAYLKVYLAETTEQRCRATTDRLGAHIRGGLSKRETAQVEAHLDECARCRALALELADVNSSLRIFVAPLVLGSGTAGYLATAAATAAKVAIAGGAVVGAGAVAAGTAGSGGAAGGAAGAASSLPRQFVGVAAGAAGLAAALALALTAGGGDQQIPQAAGQPPANPPVIQPPPNNPPPNNPPPPATQPPPPPQQSPTQPPPPGPPNLSANPPGAPISLDAGGGPADLPITVRNSGQSVSGPVSATLALPPGVTAIPSGPARFASQPLLRLDAPAKTSALAAGTVFCPGGTGTVTCGTGAGLAPGDSVTLLFRLVAAADSPGGEVTGTVSDGSAINVRVTVRVVVKPPALTDGVDVRASADWFDTLLPGLLGKRLVHVTATNTGTSSKPMTVTVNQDSVRLSASQAVNCVAEKHLTSCTTTGSVAPGGMLKVTFRLNTGLLGLHCPDGAVEVTAVLGSANDAESVKIDCLTLPGLPGLVPEGAGAPDPAPPPAPAPLAPATPQKPQLPIKPHVNAPVEKPASPPTPSPLPNVEQPPPPAETPPSGRSVLPDVLGWLLGG